MSTLAPTNVIAWKNIVSQRLWVFIPGYGHVEATAFAESVCGTMLLVIYDNDLHAVDDPRI